MRFAVEDPGDAEIEEFYAVPAGFHPNIGGLNVAMDESLGMSRPQAQGKLFADVDDLIGR